MGIYGVGTVGYVKIGQVNKMTEADEMVAYYTILFTSVRISNFCIGKFHHKATVLTSS